MHRKNRRVEMEIVEFTTDRPKPGRRGSPAIPSGTKLFALKYIGKDGYFPNSYLNREDAENYIKINKLYQTDDEFYYHRNVVMNVQDTLHYGESK